MEKEAFQTRQNLDNPVTYEVAAAADSTGRQPHACSSYEMSTRAHMMV